MFFFTSLFLQFEILPKSTQGHQRRQALRLLPQSQFLGKVKVLGWKATTNAECQEPKRKSSTCCQKRKGTGPKPMSLGLRDSQLPQLHWMVASEGTHLREEDPRQHTHSHKMLPHSPHRNCFQSLTFGMAVTRRMQGCLAQASLPPWGLRRYELPGRDPWLLMACSACKKRP